MEDRSATEADRELLAAWNHQLTRDEGHRNSMTAPELRDRMRELPETDYRAILFFLH